MWPGAGDLVPQGAAHRMPFWAVGVTLPGTFLLERALGPTCLPAPESGPICHGKVARWGYQMPDPAPAPGSCDLGPRPSAAGVRVARAHRDHALWPSCPSGKAQAPGAHRALPSCPAALRHLREAGESSAAWAPWPCGWDQAQVMRGGHLTRGCSCPLPCLRPALIFVYQEAMG